MLDAPFGVRREKMIPDFQLAMLPLLEKMKDESIHNPESLRQYAIDYFKITEEEQKLKTPNGKQILFYNRLAWSISYLRTGGLIYSPERGRYKITDLGKQVLKKPPEKITIKYLKSINPKTSIQEFEQDNNKEQDSEIKTPDEMIEEGYRRIHLELSKNILKNIEEVSPYKFEEIVVDLLIKMGYGGSDFENGEVTQKSSDEGIDGIIKEDKLGLDKIYVQAKRWKKEAKIGRPEIQKFVGALDGQRAKKGIFITTAFFTKEALEYAKNTSNATIVLIDGEQLANLMIEYEAGVTIKDIIKISKIDSDYFIEDV
jgi:restriction system protein